MTRKVPILQSILFVVLMSGPPKLRERDPGASLTGQIDWSVMLSLVVWGIAAAWILYRLAGERVILRRPRPLGKDLYLPLVFVAAIGMSVFVSPAPALSAFRVGQIGFTLLYGWMWVGRYGAENAIRHVYAGCITLTGMILIAAVMAPEMVWAKDRLRGDLIADTGAVSAMGLILLLSQPSLFRGKKQVIIGLLFVVPFVLARTRSAYAGFLLFLLVALFSLPKASRMRRVVWVCLMLVPVVLALDWLPVAANWIVRDEGTIWTLSSRTQLWAFTLQDVLRSSPLLGLGFYAERVVTLQFNTGLGSAHSAFVGVLSGAGIVGFVPFIAVLWSMGKRCVRVFLTRAMSATGLTVLGLFILILSIGVVSGEILVASPMAFVFWLLFSLGPHAAPSRASAPVVFSFDSSPYAMPSEGIPLKSVSNMTGHLNGDPSS